MNLTLYSTTYLNSLLDESVAYIPHRMWIQKLDEIPGCNRLFANIRFQNGSNRVCALQGIQEDNIQENSIYLPMWMIPHSEVLGDEVNVDILDKDAFPEALHIVLRPLDSIFYNVNEVREELSAALTKIGVLVEGDVINLHLQQGEIEVPFYVSKLLPASTCLMDGEEVTIEFEESADRWDGARPPTPPPAEPEQLVPPPSYNSMLPPPQGETKEKVWVGEGNTLGGQKRTMPDGRPWNPWREYKLPGTK
jgi:hypothetical protein